MQIQTEGSRFQPEQSFQCNRHSNHRFRSPYHSHPDEYEITLILSGNGYRISGDHFGHFGEGDIVLNGKNIPHLYQSWASDSHPASAITLHFNDKDFSFFELPEFRDIRTLLTKADTTLAFPYSLAETVRSIMESIMLSNGAIRIASFIHLLEVLSKEPQAIPLTSSDYRNHLGPKRTTSLARVLTFLQQNYNSKIELEEVADIAGFHPQSFSRFFKQHLGLPFQSYLVQLRLGHASRDILDEKKTIADIAQEAGFSNLSNFNRLFKRQFSDTPTAYLKAYRQKES